LSYKKIAFRRIKFLYKRNDERREKMEEGRKVEDMHDSIAYQRVLAENDDLRSLLRDAEDLLAEVAEKYIPPDSKARGFFLQRLEVYKKKKLKKLM
jgi:hypothetical protein